MFATHLSSRKPPRLKHEASTFQKQNKNLGAVLFVLKENRPIMTNSTIFSKLFLNLALINLLNHVLYPSLMSVYTVYGSTGCQCSQYVRHSQYYLTRSKRKRLEYDLQFTNSLFISRNIFHVH